MTGTDEKPSGPKKTCIRSKEEPDVTIVVGGQIFQEYSAAIRCWSNYFDTALSSGMQETESKHFEFLDRDPREWEWVVSVMAPLSKEKVSAGNLGVALSWFDELCSPLGMKECDRVLCTEQSGVCGDPYSKKEVIDLMEALGTAVQFGLHHSKYKCFEILKALLKTQPEILTESNLQEILILVRDHQDCRKEIFPSLKNILPAAMSSEQHSLLLENGILHHYLYSEIGRRSQLGNLGNLGKTLDTHIHNNTCAKCDSTMKLALKNDRSIGHLMPKTW